MTQASRNHGSGNWLEIARMYLARMKHRIVATVTPKMPAASGEFIRRI